ncbi:unnamed protein product [Brachionus calyciflorus]|uniref:D-Ala-D-Ala dipeptidase n=1 Tax=Brachionus calyciflorus TaxID=104777 RepID=A0A813R343_9BILA|nr:unnamed protein product [Brachionus calyciflorus]
MSLSCKKQTNKPSLPESFVYLDEINPRIITNLRYLTKENFMNQKVIGYEANRVILTKQSAIALNEAWKEFNSRGFNIVIYDAFRPTRAVQNFVSWAEDKNANQINKPSYFPYIDHDKTFDEGYIANRSGHSRGSTIDLTIINSDKSLQNVVRINRTLSDGRQILFLDDNTLDMGSSFDLFDKASNTLSNLVNETAHQNRLLLKNVMEKNGFVNYELEWWHYTLKNEPFPDTYFDFQIK